MRSVHSFAKAENTTVRPPLEQFSILRDLGDEKATRQRTDIHSGHKHGSFNASGVVHFPEQLGPFYVEHPGLLSQPDDFRIIHYSVR